MSQALRQIVYISAAARDFDPRWLQGIYAASVAGNTERAITGLLVYRDQEFMQVIEGPPQEVDRLYQRICRDPRHAMVIKLLDREIPEREFPDWAMQVADARSAGFTEFRAFGGAPPAAGLRSLAGRPSHAKRLLEQFRDALRGR